MIEISEEFRKLLHDLLDKYSVGDVSFGVLKTFYGDEAADAFNNMKNLDHVSVEFWFDKQVSLIIFNMLAKKSKLRMRSNITIEAIVSKQIPQFQQTVIDKINDALSEYGFKVTKFETPPMRFLNKEEYDEYMEGKL